MRFSHAFGLSLAVFSLLGAGCGRPPSEQLSCTMEAKICPDGSAVGRTGPNCEFAACPDAKPTDSKADLIQVTSPLPQTNITSPVHVEGRARGPWYFEASFPVQIVDANGQILGSGPAAAQGEWMTTEFVPFMADITFITPSTTTGEIIFRKDNPSGLPENEDELRVPVTFHVATTSIKIYQYSATQDTDAQGNILCSAKGLIAVDRVIGKTLTPIQDTVRELLRTEFTQGDVTLKGANLRNGTLTIELNDPQHKTSGGACKVSILRAQIEATAKQFTEVKNVVIMPDDVLQP